MLPSLPVSLPLPFRTDVFAGPLAGLTLGSPTPVAIATPNMSLTLQAFFADAAGNPLLSYDGANSRAVTLTLPTSLGTVQGPLLATSVSGVATFANLTVAAPAAGMPRRLGSPPHAHFE